LIELLLGVLFLVLSFPFLFLFFIFVHVGKARSLFYNPPLSNPADLHPIFSIFHPIFFKKNLLIFLISFSFFFLFFFL